MYYPGTILLWAATALGVFSTVAFALAVKDEKKWLERGRQAYLLMTAAVVLASCLLMYLFITHDYRLAYVWSYSDSSLPMHYLISSFWAGQEGSFLLWIFCGVLFGLPVSYSARHYESRVMLFYNLTLVALLLLLLKQSPFRFHEGLDLSMIPPDGNGLNPLLQNPWMVIHPPVMFIGYASLAVPFAFALAALWMQRYEEWTKVSLPWVLISLATLGAAIMMGGYWAYETLGWGGYWGWDPVENASLVPWLLTAALAHGLLLQRGTDRFRRLNLLLAVLCYLTVVYATFLTRSGVLSDFSVHSFVDLGISGWLVFNMLFFLFMSLAMLGWRWTEIPTEVGEEPFFSRTIFFVVGMIVLIITALVVGIGTSMPLITRLAETPSKVDISFYNTTGYWLGLVLALFLGVAPLLTWHGPKKDVRTRAYVSLGLVVVVLLISLAVGMRLPLAHLYLFAALLVIVTNSWTLLDKLRSGRWRNTGAAISHIGIGLLLVGFMTTGWFDQEQKVRLTKDVPTEVLGYSLSFKGPETNDLGREEMQVEVTTPGGREMTLRPQMWINRKSNQLVANPAIKSFPTTDLYLAPSEFSPAEAPDAGTSLVLKKNEPATFKGWSINFVGFDTSRHDPDAAGISVAVKLTMQGPKQQEPIELDPLFVTRGPGEAAGIPLAIPGTSATVQVVRIDADRGLVKLELSGLGGGIGHSATLKAGESFTYQDLAITMEVIETGEQGTVSVPFAVVRGGESLHVTPTSAQPATIPGTSGLVLGLTRIDPGAGTADVQLVDPHLSEAAGGTPSSLVLDVSTKPLIILVWIGTILALAGNCLAIVRRWQPAGESPSRPSPEPAA
jgi:cytochrome c-type biogenesis protein CcmF